MRDDSTVEVGAELRRRADWRLALPLAAAIGISFAACDIASQNQGAWTRSASELAGAPVISSDFGLAPELLRPANAGIVAVAQGPGAHLLVYAVQVGFSTRQLFGSRVLANGAIPDPGGVLLDTLEAEAFGESPVLAAYTSGHWIVMHAERSIVVGDDGVPVSRTDLPLEGAYLTGMQWGGDRALVTTADGFGFFLDGAGVPIGSPFVIFPDARFVFGGNPVAFDGSTFLVASLGTSSVSSSPPIVVSSIAATGPTGHSAELYSNSRPSADTEMGDLASNGQGFLATYAASSTQCVPPCGAWDLFRRGITVDAQGVISFRPAVAGSPGTLMVSNGTYLLVYDETGQTLDASGNPLTPQQPLFRAVADDFSSVFGPVGFDLEPERGGGGFLAHAGPLAIRVDSAFTPLDDPPLAPFLLPAPQFEPSATFASANYVVSWLDSGRGGLVAKRISPDGTVDTDPVEIAPGSARAPIVASNGTEALISWDDQGYVQAAARLTPGNGVVPVAVTDEPVVSSIDFASDGTNYLSAWTTYAFVAPRYFNEMHAALLLPNGSLTSTLDFGEGDTKLSVAFDGEQYVAIWGDVETDYERVLLAARITRTLSLVDTRPKVVLRYPASFSPSTYSPRVAAGRDGLLVVWVEATDSSQTATVHCARLTPELDLVGGSNVVLGEQTMISDGFRVVWDGSAYWVLWENVVSNTAATLVGRRLTANGRFLDAQPFEVTPGVEPGSHFGLTVGPPGELLVVYERGGTSRMARGRLLKSLWNGDGDDGGAGGEAGASGSGTGGSATGGSATGGSATGGSATGGAPVGGSSVGGSSEGGEAGALAGNGGEDSGGMPGMGGESGRGGTAPGSSSTGDDEGGGCDCSFARPRSERSTWAFAVLASAWVLRRRRMRRRAELTLARPVA